jgi:galactokinase
VLAAAIDKDMICCAAPNGTRTVTIISEQYGKIQVDTTDLKKMPEQHGTPEALIKGVFHYYLKNAMRAGGFDAILSSDIPQGAGLSSSAAFALMICHIVNDFFNGGKVGKIQLAKIAQYAENEFFGKPCGLLDQCAIEFGGMTFINFINPLCPIVEKIQPPELSKIPIVINTGGSHADLTKYYAEILSDMKNIAKKFYKNYLGEVKEEEFLKIPENTDREYLRAKHFFEENRRVKSAFNFLRQKDEEMFYICIDNSGYSSRNNLRNNTLPGEISSPITEAIDFIHKLDSSFCARVHGGGFRGTVLAFVDNDDKVLDEIYKKFGKENVMYIRFRSAGAERVNPAEIIGGEF